LKSSTFFIRDEGRIVGMLCINRDTAALEDAIERIRSIFGLGYEDRERGEIEENFSNTVEGLLSSLLANAVKRFSIPPERMRQEEKLLFIKDLERQGFFTVKGAVNAAPPGAERFRTDRLPVFEIMPGIDPCPGRKQRRSWKRARWRKLRRSRRNHFP
jgi:predicted transcriptional regulator YheO